MQNVFRLEQARGLFDEAGSLAATLVLEPFRIHWEGRSLTMGGISVSLRRPRPGAGAMCAGAHPPPRGRLGELVGVRSHLYPLGLLPPGPDRARERDPLAPSGQWPEQASIHTAPRRNLVALPRC